jgi:hypothetical protein
VSRDLRADAVEFLDDTHKCEHARIVIDFLKSAPHPSPKADEIARRILDEESAICEAVA